MPKNINLQKINDSLWAIQYIDHLDHDRKHADHFFAASSQWEEDNPDEGTEYFWMQAGVQILEGVKKVEQAFDTAFNIF